MITLTLPFPPGVNNLFATVGRHRIRTRRYEAWIVAAMAVVRTHYNVPIKGPFTIALSCDRPDRRKRDLDGLAKAPLDLLVKAGLIEDDSLAQHVSIRWTDAAPAKPGAIRLTLEAV